MWLVLKLNRWNSLSVLTSYGPQRLNRKPEVPASIHAPPLGFLLAFDSRDDALNWADGDEERLVEIAYDFKVK